MNVLEIIRKEFNVDNNRTYLMGHSMGGAGTLYLGSKYASNWAAIGAIAPAAFAMQANAADLLTPVKDMMPVIVTQGAADTAVSVANTRTWIAAMGELKMDFRYIERAATITAASSPRVCRTSSRSSRNTRSRRATRLLLVDAGDQRFGTPALLVSNLRVGQRRRNAVTVIHVRRRESLRSGLILYIKTALDTRWQR